MSFAFSNAPLPGVIADLEKMANAQPGPKLSLGLGQLPSGPWNADASIPVTFTATQIPVVDAFRIVGSVAGYAAMFRGLDGILAEHCHGHGEMTIFLSGRCVDASTGTPIKSLSVSREFCEIRTKESGEFIHPIQVTGTTELIRCGSKNYRLKTEPAPREIRFVVTSPGYQPQEYVVSTHGTRLTYTNNIEMKRVVQRNSP